MKYGRIAEIDALKRNLSSILMEIETFSPDVGDAHGDFHRRLDDLIEASNIRIRQIAALGDLIETAYRMGRLSR